MIATLSKPINPKAFKYDPDNCERPQRTHTFPPQPITKPALSENYFDRQAGLAEGYANELLAVWCEYGTANSYLDPHLFPTARHAAIARVVINATSEGVRGWPEIAGRMLGDETLRNTFFEAVQERAFPMSPAGARPLADFLRKFYVAKTELEIGQKIAKRIEAREPWQDLREKLDELETVKAEGLSKTGIADLLAERAFDFLVAPTPPMPVLKLGGKTVITPGNLANVQGPVKAGKSAILGAVMAAVLNGNRQGPDTLGFSAENTQGHALIHLDTEQSRFDHDALVRRALKRARLVEAPPWLMSFSVTDLNIAERLEGLDLLLKDATELHGGVFLVIIDGVADLCLDPNDPAESFALIGHLHASAIKYNCGILTVLHENPGSLEGKTRGHLGSQLERKAETNLRLAKDKDGLTTVWSDRARHGNTPRDQGLCFQWSDEAGMHVSCGTAREIKATAKHAKFRDEAESAFGDSDRMSYTDLVARIVESVGVVEKTAEKRIKTYAAEGLVVKSQEGVYTLRS